MENCHINEVNKTFFLLISSVSLNKYDTKSGTIIEFNISSQIVLTFLTDIIHLIIALWGFLVLPRTSGSSNVINYTFSLAGLAPPATAPTRFMILGSDSFPLHGTCLFPKRSLYTIQFLLNLIKITIHILIQILALLSAAFSTFLLYNRYV